ncbi:MAG: transporter substrate-binding domain-containing protein, partial [Bacteroidota bacterium]
PYTRLCLIIPLTMRKFLFFLFLGISSLGFAQVKTLQLASDAWPPFTDGQNNSAFALDLVKKALGRQGIKVKDVSPEFSNVIEGIQEKKYDGSAALWKTAEREEFLLFSAPYLKNQLVLVALKGKDVSARNMAELSGQQVAIVDNYAYGDSVNLHPDVKFVKGKSDQDNLEKLLRKEVDYMLADALLVQYVLHYQREKAIAYLEIGDHALFTRSLHFAIRKDLEGAEGIIKAFNQEILNMLGDGTYSRILGLNWIKTDVDGDGNLELVLNGRKAGVNAPQRSYSLLLDNMPAATPKGSFDRYYINGKFYQGWDKVPPQYKKPLVTKEDRNKLKLLQFGF